jgi:hypothetical protein
VAIFGSPIIGSGSSAEAPIRAEAAFRYRLSREKKTIP